MPVPNKKLEENARFRRARRLRMKRALISFKLTVGCQSCGYCEHPDALQLDHITPVGNARTRVPWTGMATWVKFWAFLLSDETQVLCANCHAIKSAEEQRNRPDVVRLQECAQARVGGE